MDLNSINTPVNYRQLRRLLRESNYDRHKTKFLVNGFKNGFDIEYRGPLTRQDRSRNIPFSVGNEKILWEKIMKEVKAKRYAGPFDEIPFRNFMQSPIGLVPKSGGQTRLIFHLSFDFGPENRSLNFHTPEDLCKVKYNDLDYALKTIFKLDSTLPIYCAKTDIQSAFRVLPLKRSCYRWLIMMAKNPNTGKKVFFVEKNLPFGASISCFLFQEFSNCLKHIFEYHMGRKMLVTNYLDDFLFVENTKESCNFMVRSFLRICETVGVPIANEKTEWGSTKMIFLGILIDGESKLLCIPENKRIKAVNLLLKMLDSKKSTVGNLQSLSGLLNFLCKAIFPGRAFTRRMYAKFSGKMEILKSYHHINLDKEFKNDCAVWLEFLDKSMVTAVSRPFIDMNVKVIAKDVGFTSDASAGRTKGFGTVFGKSFCFSGWERGFIERFNPNIEFLELYALCMGVFVWIERLQNSRIWVHCDNKGVCGMINNTTSGCKYCMILMRMLTLKCLKYNLRIFAVYIKSKDNDLSDSLSRLKLNEFKRLTRDKNFDRFPTPPSNELWPLSSLWEQFCLSL